MLCVCAIFSSVACPVLQNVSTFTQKRHDSPPKMVLNTNRVFCFSLQLLSETFLILRRTERDMIKNVYRSSCNVLVIVWQILMEIEFSRQTFKKQSNMKLHENPSSGSRIFPCWTDVRSDGHNETGQSLFFSAISRNAPKKNTSSFTVKILLRG